MNQSHAELCMIQLELVVRQAALPAEQQLAKLKQFDVAFEIGNDFENFCRWALEGEDAPQLSDEQRSCLIELDQWLNDISSRHEGLGTAEAVLNRPEWEVTRRKARNILAAFGWPLEGPT
jgi:hypothetical protein